MTISQIIAKHYDELASSINKNRSHQSSTEEDEFHNKLIVAINKYGDTDLTEEEGLDYLKKTIFYLKNYFNKEKKKDILVFTDEIETYHYGSEEI